MTEMTSKITRSAWTSVLIGGPIGIVVILMTIFLPVILTGEGLFMLAFGLSYAHATIGFVIAFIFSLWVAGKKAFSDLSNGQSLILTSRKYSVNINIYCWLTFIVIAAIDNYLNGLFNWYILVPPIVLLLICPVLTTFSVGLLVCYIIKGQIPAPNSSYQ